MTIYGQDKSRFQWIAFIFIVVQFICDLPCTDLSYSESVDGVVPHDQGYLINLTSCVLCSTLPFPVYFAALLNFDLLTCQKVVKCCKNVSRLPSSLIYVHHYAVLDNHTSNDHQELSCNII